MQFLSLEPFVPSGPQFELSKQLFQDIGFNLTWDVGDMTGFAHDHCKFILQHYNEKSFAENFMLSVRVSSIEDFQTSLKEMNIAQKYGVKISPILHQPYGKEINLIDLAGVCWHFVE